MKKYVITFYVAVSLSVFFSIACLFLDLIQIENVHLNMIHNVFIGLLSSSLFFTVTSLFEYFAERKRALIELNSIIQQAIVLFENIRRVPDIDNYLDTEFLREYIFKGSSPIYDSPVHKKFEEYVTQIIRENYRRDVCEVHEKYGKHLGPGGFFRAFPPKSLPLDEDELKKWREEFLKSKYRECLNGRLEYCYVFGPRIREPWDYFATACEKFDMIFVNKIQCRYNDLVYRKMRTGLKEDDEPINIDYEDLLKEAFEDYLGFGCEVFEIKQKKQEMKKNILENLNSIIQPYIKIRDWYDSYDFKILCESFFFIYPFANKSHKEFLKEEIFGFISYFCEKIACLVRNCLLYLNDFDYIRLHNSPPWGSGKTTENFKTDGLFNYLVYEVYRKIVIHRHYYYVKRITNAHLYENKVSRYLIKAHQYIFKLIKFKKTADVADLKRDLTSDWEDVKKLPKEKAPTFML